MRVAESAGEHRAPYVLTAAWLYAAPGRWHRGGGVVVDGDRVLAVLASREAVRRATGAKIDLVDAGDTLLTPGLVVAHAHLELSALAGRVPPGRDFPEWIERLMAARAATSRDELAVARARAAELFVARGATTVADVDSLDLWRDRRAMPRQAPRCVVQREFLDAHDEVRREHALRRAARPLAPAPLRHEALAPHSPYTASAALLAGLARVSERRALSVTVHWAETREETDWLAGRPGPFDRLLGPAASGPAGLARIAAAGLLGPRTALVHANHPDEGDLDRVARARASVVHCPGAHAFFGRERFPLDDWLAAGVTVALGTDSAAGNAALDPLRELGLLRRSHPALDPLRALEMATADGARAVGLEGRVGVLTSGAYADVAAWALGGDDPSALADALTRGESPPAAVWVGGRPLNG